MARKKKTAANVDIKSWLTERNKGDCHFIVVGESLLLSEQFQKLPASAKVLYLQMVRKAAGKDCFEFPRRDEKSINMYPSMAATAKRELEQAGFIFSFFVPDSMKKQFYFIDTWKTTANGKGGFTASLQLSATLDCKEEKITLIGASLLTSPAFTDLSYSAQILYICMASEAGGSRNFVFSPKVGKKYGYAKTTLREAIRALTSAGLIEDNPDSMKPGAYRFSFVWKQSHKKTAPVNPEPINITEAYERFEERKKASVDFVS